jgi:hypothetical protein
MCLRVSVEIGARAREGWGEWLIEGGFSPLKLYGYRLTIG